MFPEGEKNRLVLDRENERGFRRMLRILKANIIIYYAANFRVFVSYVQRIFEHFDLMTVLRCVVKSLN